MNFLGKLKTSGHTRGILRPPTWSPVLLNRAALPPSIARLQWGPKCGHCWTPFSLLSPKKEGTLFPHSVWQSLIIVQPPKSSTASALARPLHKYGSCLSSVLGMLKGEGEFPPNRFLSCYLLRSYKENSPSPRSYCFRLFTDQEKKVQMNIHKIFFATTGDNNFFFFFPKSYDS